MGTADLNLPFDAFVRSVGINKLTPHALFLGAGASISSNVPSAQMCIWEWKRAIFLTNNPGLERQFDELSLPSVKQKIQCWLDAQGRYPALGAPDEYSFYIEACYPIADNRRAFFQEKIRQAKPHIGYVLTCLLAQSQLIRSVWSTNFDGMVARAAANFHLTPIEIGIDCQERLPRTPRTGEILCISLHGDYRYDELKNTAEELQDQEAQLREGLVSHLKDESLIVCGFSGRDASVMEALASAYRVKGPGILYWCGREEGDIPPNVMGLIETARAADRTAYYVRIPGFDEVMSRLALHCLTGDALDKARELTSSLVSTKIADRVPFAVEDLPIVGIIKSNAFEIECPSEVFEVTPKSWPEKGVWKWLRELIAGKEIVAVPSKGKVLAFGRLDEIKDLFRDNLQGNIERTPIAEVDLKHEDGAVVCLLREALVRSLAQRANLATDGSRQLWVHEQYETRRGEGGTRAIHESAVIFLRRQSGRMILVVKPSVKAFSLNGEPIPLKEENQLKLGVLGYQHNKQFNQAMNRWRDRLFPKDQLDIEFPLNCGSTFRFRPRRAPTFAKICGRVPYGGMVIPPAISPHLKHSGLLLEEPQLVFSSRAGNGLLKESHPIRGIVMNRPYDFPLTQRGLVQNVRVGIVCPAEETSLLEANLHRIQQRHQPSNSESDYLLDFPGFDNAFGTPIELPRPGSSGWITCPSPSNPSDDQTGTLELSQLITRSIGALHAACAPNVIIVFIPNQWKQWRGFETDTEKFNLHDFVKAYCVQRGIATQFLEQDTFADPLQCRVWWWLSLAMYVKSMRTPWVLDSLDQDTAFVGLGFTLDRHAQRGNQVVLGCSHIYNARGEGLQYRLSKIENPIIRQGNPYMSADDARNVGETIRYLFYESRQKLPSRVVIHKLTPFMKDERQGLQDGLGGITQIDLLEINTDPALRYVASVARPGGGFDEDNYPVKRGTTVRLDGNSALIWVHGVTSAVNERLRYYQGKRRIPAPLVVKRHAGNSDLRTIAAEILGLSKMNWNTFDLYTKLPATVHSSNEIARIGALLKRYGNNSYDFRLFI